MNTMPELKTFTFWSDPGHGWLEVTRDDMKDLGLKPSDFSSYSYMKGSTFYLEEDCDASKFVHAYDAKYGCRIATRDEYREDIFIRGLYSIPQKIEIILV